MKDVILPNSVDCRPLYSFDVLTAESPVTDNCTICQKPLSTAVKILPCSVVKFTTVNVTSHKNPIRTRHIFERIKTIMWLSVRTFLRLLFTFRFCDTFMCTVISFAFIWF